MGTAPDALPDWENVQVLGEIVVSLALLGTASDAHHGNELAVDLDGMGERNPMSSFSVTGLVTLNEDIKR
jgi:hypothetical protein